MPDEETPEFEALNDDAPADAEPFTPPAPSPPNDDAQPEEAPA